MQHILVALDPTPSASDILAAALDIAAGTGAKMSLLRVVEGAGEMPESDAALIARAEAQLRELVRGRAPSRIHHVRAAVGTPSHEIVRSAEAEGADLVIIGAHRYNVLERAVGTTAAYVVKHCSSSLLVLRSWRDPISRVLVAIDDSETADVVRGYAVHLARHMRAKVRLFRVFDVPECSLEQLASVEAAVQDNAEKALSRQACLIPPELYDGSNAKCGPVAWSEIRDAVRGYDPDLVVLGSHRHSLTQRLLGTTAAEVVNRAGRTVLVVKRTW